VPTIITATQLRSVLGVSSSLYNDAYLDQIIDSAELTVLPMLVSYSQPISGAKLTNNVAYYYYLGQPVFSKGQAIIVTNVGTTFNGNHIISAVGDGFFESVITHADIAERRVIPSGKATLNNAATYVGNQAVQSAIYVVSTEIFQSRTAAGGQIEGVDFAPTPYRMGKSLISRVTGLLAPYLDTDSICQ
jgi:hypothetical protein